MTDDIVVEEESPDHNEEAEAAFEEAALQRQGEEPEETDDTDSVDKDAEVDEEEEEKEDESSDDETDDEDKSWTEKFSDRVKSSASKIRESLSVKKEPDKPKEKKKTKTDVAGKFNITKEDIKDALDGIDFENLPGHMVSGNVEINLKELAEEDPENFAAFAVLAKKFGGTVNESLSNEIQELKSQLSEVSEWKKNREERDAQDKAFNEIWDAVEYGDGDNKAIPDAYKTAHSKEFNDWFSALENSKNKEDQDLFVTGVYAKEPDDYRAVISKYLIHKAKRKAKPHDDKAKEEKEKFDKVHSDKPSGKKMEKRGSESTDDGEEAFKQAAKEREERRRKGLE